MNPDCLILTPRSYSSILHRVSLALALVCCLLLAVGRANAAGERVPLPKSIGTMRPAVAATKRALNAKDLANPLDFSVALQMRNFEELQARVARGETFPRAELERRYLPLQADYDAVKAWARSQGLTIRQEDGSRMSVFLRGSVSQVQSSLVVNMVKVTSEGTDFPAADSEPSLPDTIASKVIGVNGLHPYHHLHRHLKKRAQISPAAASAVTYTVPQILSIYDAANLGVTGAGQTIAILIDATPKTSDLAGFYAANGLPASTVNNVTTINVNNTTITTTEEEETLDVEWTSGVAPGAKIRVYATGDLQDASLDRGLARILSDAASDSTIHQLSISLGGGETFNTTAQFTTDGQYFAALASQGVSTFVSAGDDGSTPNGTSGSATLQVEYYSSDPSVTAVGGTAVRVDSTYKYNANTAETVWGPYTTTNGATGGGVSIAFKKPTWQTGTGVPTGTMRYVPDVAMPADPYTGAYVYYNGAGGDLGGTSWSAPTWAGFCALINEARANAGKTGGIGLLNPSLYPLIGTSNFHDITVGNNINNSTAAAGKYTATAGYDECTGVGTPDVKVLMNTLVSGGTTAATAPTITSISPTSGTVGTTITITGTNLANAETVGFFSQPGNDGGTTYTVVSATQITVTVPPAAQTGPITVTTPGGTASSGTFAFTAASGAPAITSFTPTSGSVTTLNSAGTAYVYGTAVTITGTGFSGTTKVTFNGVEVPTFSASSTRITTYVSLDAITGPLTVTTARGKAVSAATFTVNSTTSVNAPTITGFTPTSGPVGTSVTIAGTGFTQTTGVKFNGTAASVVTVVSDTQLTATVPGGATSGGISVTDSTGTGTSAGTFTVTGTSTTSPTITGFTPASGAVGTAVTITGTNLAGATAVSFNGTAATITSNSATQIVTAVPTGATTGVISVTTSGGTVASGSAFTVTTSGGTGSGAVVISQIYGGGGNAGSSYANDYIELFNPGTSAVNLSGYSVQYASATGSSWSPTPLKGSIAPQHYYLVQESAGTTATTALPAPDATGTTGMSTTAGKVALVNGTTALSGSTGVSTASNVVDFVGYGTTASDYRGTGPAPAPTSTTADVRGNGGYTNNQVNSTDFTASPPNPRNSASPANAPDLTITLAHAGSFTQADTGDTYTITVTNSGNAATIAAVNVADTLPAGLTATAISGTGWTCDLSTLTATRSDALTAGGSYPVITLTVNVSSTAAASVTNTAMVSGGGETNTTNDTATDVTAITALTPTQSWRYQYFGTTANAGNAADSANPSGDGIPNLLKYALNLNPLVPTASPGTEDLSSGYLQLTVPKNPNATDLTYTVQVTGDLTDPTSWTTNNTQIIQNTSTLLQVRDGTPISGTAKRFIRLQVTR